MTLPASLSAGAYFVIARADSAAAVVETQEGNNTRATAVQLGADLVIVAITVPATAGAGQPITVSDSTKNQGGALAGASTTSFYLSTNNVLDPGDMPLGSRAVPGIN